MRPRCAIATSSRRPPVSAAANSACPLTSWCRWLRVPKQRRRKSRSPRPRPCWPRSVAARASMPSRRVRPKTLARRKTVRISAGSRRHLRTGLRGGPVRLAGGDGFRSCAHRSGLSPDHGTRSAFRPISVCSKKFAPSSRASTRSASVSSRTVIASTTWSTRVSQVPVRWSLQPKRWKRPFRRPSCSIANPVAASPCSQRWGRPGFLGRGPAGTQQQRADRNRREPCGDRALA